MIHVLIRINLLVLLLLLGGCKTELYSGLSEKEANEMYAILYQAGIHVEKKTLKGQQVTLKVEENQSATAIQLLKNQGYPKEQFATIGDIFSKEGIISSPVEERARLMYALSQEVSSTLSQIDGVLTARVHIVMPEKAEFGEKTAPSSASVFLKHTPKTQVEPLKEKIKELVANSINDLHTQQVSVAFFPAQLTDQETLSINQGVFSSENWWLLLVLLLVVIGAIVAGYFYISRRGSLADSKEPVSAAT